MKAVELICTPITCSEPAFAELVKWRLPEPVEGSSHRFKYRRVYVVRGACVLRYDNEAGKGNHRHFGKKESNFMLTTPEQLITDVQKDIARWDHENTDT